MKKVAVYPGSFDPITLGHVDIIQRVARLYDELIVLVAESSAKTSLLSVAERMKLISQSFTSPGQAQPRNIKVDFHEGGLTVDYARKIGASVIVRGLRAVVDFEYELSMANINKTLAPEIETVLIFASPEYYFVSSRAVKELVRNGGDAGLFVPAHVIKPLVDKLNSN